MFVHLHVHSPFSFLEAGSSIQALVDRAAALGMEALALTDRNRLSGAVAFTRAAAEAGIRPILGAEVTLVDGTHLTLLAGGPEGYASLSQLLTRAHLSRPRGKPAVAPEALERYHQGLIALSGCRRGEIARRLLWGDRSGALRAAERYASLFGRENFYIELQNNRLPGGRALNDALREVARQAGLEWVATQDVHYATPDRFPLFDALTCVRTGTRLPDVHPERRLNGTNYLTSPQEMAALFPDDTRALQNTLEIARRCRPALPEKPPNLFPAFPVSPGESSLGLLRRLTYQGARRRYGHLTARIRRRLEHELEVIGKLDVADAFLVAWDLIRFARERGIRHAGRGSAADSAVAYCLGLTEVDSIGRGLLFERFLSLERAQKPDIDVDFEAERRDEVAAYVYRRYGAERVASVCTFQTYHARSALRDLGKVLGFPEEEIGPLAKRFPHIPADRIPQALQEFPELRDSRIPLERYRLLFELASQVAGFPRHIGTHLGGLVLSREPLDRVAPLETAAKGVTILSFDKDDVEALGLIKLDLLSLRTLSAVGTATRAIQVKEPSFRYEAIPRNDRATFRMLGRGETVGAFQLESPAQRALQARLGADSIEDVVASVALIRPGPIKGDMVEPFLRRRRGLEPISYVDPRLAPILEKTYGVVLYQEQVIEIATVIAGFTPGESDRLRRVMTHYRSHEEMERIGRHFVAKAVARGTSHEVAEVIFSYIVGYAGYGFCEAHAAAFADTAYKTAYLLRHYPAEFYAALLSHQPMGFYPPNTLVHEARRRGIQVLPPHINRSEKHCTVEEGRIRISLALVREVRQADLEEILAERKQRPFTSLEDLCRRTHLTREGLTYLILAGALDSFDANRRRLLFGLEGALRQREEPLAPRASAAGARVPLQQRLDLPRSGPLPDVADFSPEQRLLLEYEALGLTTERHLMTLLEPELRRLKVTPSSQLRRMEAGRPVRVAGLLIRPHRPPTRSGRIVVFLTLEDAHGMLDVTVFENVYQRDGEAIFGGYPVLVVDGRVTWRGKGVSVDATRVRALKSSPGLAAVARG